MADFEPQWLKFVSTGWTARQIGMLLPISRSSRWRGLDSARRILLCHRGPILMLGLKIFGTFLLVWFFVGLALSFRPYRLYISKPHIFLAAAYFLCGILAAVIWI